jgi:hypothetical protein
MPVEPPKLFMLLLGCRPPGRHTEQHDVFFGIGSSLKALIPQIRHFWRGAGPIHIDAWREVTQVEGYAVQVVPRQQESRPQPDEPALFFINLGGYKENQFDEFHYKMLVVAKDKAAAIRKAKESAFYKHTGIQGAPAHIDDKWGIDVDDLYLIQDILPAPSRLEYSLALAAATTAEEDAMHLGYFRLDRL